jgi:hypothetical protein
MATDDADDRKGPHREGTSPGLDILYREDGGMEATALNPRRDTVPMLQKSPSDAPPSFEPTLGFGAAPESSPGDTRTQESAAPDFSTSSSRSPISVRGRSPLPQPPRPPKNLSPPSTVTGRDTARHASADEETILRTAISPRGLVESDLEEEDIPTAVDLDDDDEMAELPDPNGTGDETNATLSMNIQADATREVYRLFLANEFGPALALVNQLLARGGEDPMFVTIARECRTSLDAQQNGGDAPAKRTRSRVFSKVHGKMTLEQLATSTGMSLEQLLTLLERLVRMGVLTVRAPEKQS